ARTLETAEDEEVVALLARHPAERSARVMRRLTPDRAARLVAEFEAPLLRSVLGALEPGRAAGLVARLDPEQQETALAPLDPALAGELRALAAYPRDCAGGLMDPRITTFRPDTLVRDVIRRMRSFRRRRVQDVFVVDPDDHLLGGVSLQEIVLAPSDTLLESLMRPVPSVSATASRDDVMAQLAERRGSSLPVVDYDGRVLGVLRQDELLTVAQEDAAADAVAMVGAGRDERALSSPLFAVRKRLPWLQINLLTAFLAASVVGIFEETIAAFTALAVLLPVVAGQSGNTGAQALAVTMRGLALREVRTRQWLRVVVKEVLAGAGNGVAVALTTSVAVYFWSGSTGLALVIGVSMVLSMTIAGLSGAAIPMVLTALRQDPAQSSSIILTTVTDVAGFFSFLGIATLLSGML
ncbi:MAG: magnesium transporter, partial [Myxococcota bacterium]